LRQLFEIFSRSARPILLAALVCAAATCTERSPTIVCPIQIKDSEEFSALNQMPAPIVEELRQWMADSPEEKIGVLIAARDSA
jgi:hypothetical protein